MADLEIPPQPDELFLALGEEVNTHRPLLTGDVFRPVEVPVLAGRADTFVVVAHPCAMRKGAELADLLSVAPVVDHGTVGDVVWRKHFKVFPLDRLPGFARPVARLDLATLTPSADLGAASRIACLSRAGINLLRQRLVHQLTRVVVETARFDEEAAGTYEEIDLLEEWTEAAAEVGVDAGTAAHHFDEWIRTDDGGATRQHRLADPQTAASVRRATTTELRARYQP